MTPVKNQGSLGSCVAFATAALKEWQEWQEFLKEKDCSMKRNLYDDLSEQWIYYKTKEVDNIPGEGTTIRAALYVLKKYGVPPEKSWLYDPYEKGCPKEDANLYAEYAKIDDFFRIKNLRQLKIALLHSPVPAGLVVFPSWQNQKNGKIPLPNKKEEHQGGHAICVVGYDDTSKSLKFKNSWSSSWGQNGYGFVSYEYAKKYMLAAWAVKDSFVPYSYLRKLLNK
jgi:hypothetical protein